MTTTSYLRQSKTGSVENDRFPSLETASFASRAILSLRDYILQTTGRRIWGLTFTLYPDGKFNVEYDYNKPPDYEEDDDDVAATSEATPVANLLGGLLGNAVRGASEDQTPESQRLFEALTLLQRQTAEHSANWGLGSETNWNLDINEGWLSWTLGDGRVVQAAVQVVGTYNTKNNSFMLGWDHPSVPEPLRRAAQQVHTLGQELGIHRWTTRSVDCTEDEAWQFTALAAQQDGASGAYRGDANGTWVYMSFGEPSIDGNPAKDQRP
ncbi:hypothetical protein ASE11_03905 [Hydrogenophaga sp. Root209]|nr:hypothetical protein ASE11_03905 [Hydrogenophaga sp. Root209]